MKDSCNILLVGEGNFSFSVSLSETSCPNTHITATCYEAEEVIARQKDASSHVQRLKEKGADVHFQVDCTRLQSCPALTHAKFDCIIFNFPHCGRKAGIKKNRELLAKFFLSCAEVLTETGEVHVALCRGQGGTPADQPVRERHNSWQIVDMAAGAGFILSKVIPFDASEYCRYKNTGYRSQDKSFHIEGAVNHVFIRSLPILCPRSVIVQAKADEEWISFHVPEELVEKISRNFLESTCHPVSMVHGQLIQDVSEIFPLHKLNHSLNPLVRINFSTSSFCGCKDLLASLYVVRSINYKNSNHWQTESKSLGTDLSLASLNVKDSCREGRDHGSSIAINTRELGSTEYYLRPSLLVDIWEIANGKDFLPKTLYTVSGPVFRKCLISSYTMPAYHEILFIWGSNDDSGIEFLHSLKDNVSKSITSLLKLFPDHTVTFSQQPNDRRKNDQSWFVNNKELLAEKHFTISVNFGHDFSDTHDINIGNVYVTPSGQIHKELGFCIAVLNLDILAMLCFKILDWRMLWTFDEHFINQYEQVEVRLFKNFSLYPPSFTHDISFWISPGGHFNELEFHTVIRRITGEMVKDIILIDRFEHPDSGQISQCYRMIYQSCDKALSHQKASELQLCLRQALQECLQIVLR